MSFVLSTIVTLGVITAVFFLIRQSLRRSERLTGTQCPTCGREMDRIHRNVVVKAISSALPMRTLFCRACKKKRYRVKPLRTAALPE